MKRAITAIFLTTSCLSPGFAQTATGVGTGVANSRSSSAAVAISGQGGNGGSSLSSSNLTLNSSVPAVQTLNQNVSGTQTIKNVPTVFAPGLTAAGLETCLGSISAGAGVVGTGATFGTTIPDAGCAARLDARTLWSMGLKKAAVARLCLMSDIYKSMPEVCDQYLPQATPVGYVAPPSYRGGPILLVEGKTGQDRLCNDYDETRQRCRVWAYAVTHHSASSKKVVMRMGTTTQAAQPSAKVEIPPPVEITEGKSQ